MKSSKISIFVSCMLMTLGIAMIVFSFLYKTKYEKFMETAVSGSATITNITTIVKGESKEDEHHVKLTYVIDGTTYTKDTLDWDASMKEGKTITIYYNPSNPEEMVTYATDYNNYILIIIGAIITIVFAIDFIKNVTNNNRINVLINTGKEVNAKINSLYSDPKYSDNEQIYILNCSYTDRDLNKEYLFNISGITLKMKKYIDRNNISMIPVFYDQNDPKNYFIDYRVLQKKKK